MNSRRRVRNSVWRICAAAILCAAAGVSAQTIYKQVGPGGSITYTDRPDATPSPQPETVPALDVANALAGKTAMSSRGAALIDANEAARRLRQTQLEHAQDAKRLPGAQADGTDASAASDRHRRRLEERRRAIERAQIRLHEARRSLHARR